MGLEIVIQERLKFLYGQLAYLKKYKQIFQQRFFWDQIETRIDELEKLLNPT